MGADLTGVCPFKKWNFRTGRSAYISAFFSQDLRRKSRELTQAARAPEDDARHQAEVTPTGQFARTARCEERGQRRQVANGGFRGWFGGTDYMLELVLPDFFFHVATAHAILRHLGAPIGKRTYLGHLSQESGGAYTISVGFVTLAAGSEGSRSERNE